MSDSHEIAQAVYDDLLKKWPDLPAGLPMYGGVVLSDLAPRQAAKVAAYMCNGGLFPRCPEWLPPQACTPEVLTEVLRMIRARKRGRLV